MIYGTAGYTAGLAIERLEKVGMNIEDGPVTRSAVLQVVSVL